METQPECTASTTNHNLSSTPTELDGDNPTDKVLTKAERKRISNPYSPGRGHGRQQAAGFMATATKTGASARPPATLSRSTLSENSFEASSADHTVNTSLTSNRFAALQYDDGSITATSNTQVTPHGDCVKFAEDQALAHQLFGSGWTPAPSRSKDSAATLAASRT